MADRSHDRIPATLQVEFRTATSLLVAYSTNVSRGGMFLETEAELEIGAAVMLALAVPDEPTVEVTATVAWRRGRESPDGPPGLGVQFGAAPLALGAAIDRLVGAHVGITLLLVPSRRTDGPTLVRLVRTAIAKADLLVAGGPDDGAARLSAGLDALVIAVDADDELEPRLAVVQAAAALTPRLPVVAVVADAAIAARCAAAGAADTCLAPLDFADLQAAVVRALGRPSAVR
jgi:uncharacterized protein (TIGR02266 family)